MLAKLLIQFESKTYSQNILCNSHEVSKIVNTTKYSNIFGYLSQSMNNKGPKKQNRK